MNALLDLASWDLYLVHIKSGLHAQLQMSVQKENLDLLPCFMLHLLKESSHVYPND